MNLHQQVQEEKLAEIRNEITPQGDQQEENYSISDSDGFVDEEIRSNQQQELGICENAVQREKGQTETLEPLPIEEKAQNQQQEKKVQQGGKEETLNKNDNKNQVNSFRLAVDSKYIYASFYLLRQEFKKVLQPLRCYLRFNPYLNNKQITIFYYDESKKKKIIEKVEQLLYETQVIEMGKSEAEGGVQLSYKFMEQLQKQKITIFRDKSQNFKTTSYYICGRVASKKILHEKISQIRKMNFIWMHLYRFENTRSYRAILRKIFHTPQIHTLIYDKFRCKQIEVAYLRKDYSLPENTNKRGVFILLTSIEDKKIKIYQQIQNQLSAFIQENYLLFCFTFTRQKESYQYRYTPKIDKVIMFFITEKIPALKTSYLYIIVKTKDFNEVRETIIKEIQSMKLNIFGQRFFKSFTPEKPATIEEIKPYRLFSFPKSRPYSWTLKPKKGQPFDWEAQLKFQLL